MPHPLEIPTFLKQDQMRIYHFLKRHIDYRTYAAWSRDPTGKALIFIHGFNGSANATWNDFYGLYGNFPEFSGYDLFFYQYDSMNVQANNVAVNFYHLIDELYKHPNNSITTCFPPPRNKSRTADRQDAITLPDREGLTYSKIVIVAHSLGAVVTRRALLFAKKDRREWVDLTSMILFAPAHMGARAIPHLRSLLFPWPLKFLAGLIEFKLASLDDLMPHSDTLNDILAETKELKIKGEHQFTIAKSVVWAGKELIVYNANFLDDPNPIEFEDKDHINVCKSSPEFLRPIEEIKKVL
jgi:pimeloyl-ACP methyl ester carboxylesterase